MSPSLSFRNRPRTLRIVLHDSQTPPSQSHIQHFLAAKGRSMGLLEIGYHFLLPRDTIRVIECRPVTAMGTHCKGRSNEETIGVCLAGGTSEEVSGYQDDSGAIGPRRVPEDNFTPFQLDNLRALTRRLAALYGPLPLVGHSEERPGHKRQCPAIDMEKVRQWVGT